MAAPGYVGMSVTPEARDHFRRMAALATGRAQRQLGVSEVMIASAILTERHLDELVQILEGDAK